MPRRRMLTSADELLDLLAHRAQADVQLGQGPCCDALAFMNEPEQDVLGADVVVVEHPGLFLSQDHDLSRPVGKSLEHLASPRVQCAPKHGVRKSYRFAAVDSRSRRSASQAAYHRRSWRASCPRP